MIFNVNGKLLDACVLGLLKEKDTYGYDLTQSISKYMEVSESTLYPVLRRLLKEEHLSSYEKQFDGRNRKYYHITPTGYALHQQYREDWRKHKQIVTNLIEGEDDHEQGKILKEIS